MRARRGSGQRCRSLSQFLSLPHASASPSSPLRGAICAPPPRQLSLPLPPAGGALSPPSALLPHFLPPGGQPGQEPAFPAFLHSELSDCEPHLHPSPSGGNLPGEHRIISFFKEQAGAWGRGDAYQQQCDIRVLSSDSLDLYPTSDTDMSNSLNPSM